MPNSSIIPILENGVQVYPETIEEAVSDANGVTLDVKMADILNRITVLEHQKEMDQLLARVSNNYGGIVGKEDVVETFFRSLGADGTNDIWGKIKALYMPCLAIPSDGAKALYNIITEINYPGSSYTVEAKRGIGPTTMGGSIGANFISTILDENMSGFCVVTQSARQTLSNSSGAMIGIYGTYITWKRTEITVSDGTSSASVPNNDAFTKPNFIVLSKKENGLRTLSGRDGNTTTDVTKQNNDLYLSGPAAWADTSIYALCDGLTADESAIVSAAIETFITDFGIECAN